MKTLCLSLIAVAIMFVGCGQNDSTTSDTSNPNLIPMTETATTAALTTDADSVCNSIDKLVNEGLDTLTRSKKFCKNEQKLFRQSLAFLAKGDKISTTKPELLLKPKLIKQVNRFTLKLAVFLEKVYLATQASAAVARQTGSDPTKFNNEVQLIGTMFSTVQIQIGAYDAFVATQDPNQLLNVFGANVTKLETAATALFESQCGQYGMVLLKNKNKE